MRNALLSIFALGAITAAGTAPAAAYDYPYCLQGRGVGIPGDCSYSTYAQCKASASGRSAACAINPRVAFGRQGYGPGYGYGPQPDRRPPPRRYYRDYY